MNVIRVTKAVTVSAPLVAPQSFQVNDLVAPSSVFYWPLLWSGAAVDSGIEDTTGTEQTFHPDLVVVGPDDPELGSPGIWVQTFPNGDWTLWIEDGESA